MLGGQVISVYQQTCGPKAITMLPGVTMLPGIDKTLWTRLGHICSICMRVCCIYTHLQ